MEAVWAWLLLTGKVKPKRKAHDLQFPLTFHVLSKKGIQRQIQFYIYNFNTLYYLCFKCELGNACI